MEIRRKKIGKDSLLQKIFTHFITMIHLDYFFPHISLSQWLNFKLFGITYLVGKIKFKPFFFRVHWLSETYFIPSKRSRPKHHKLQPIAAPRKRQTFIPCTSSMAPWCHWIRGPPKPSGKRIVHRDPIAVDGRNPIPNHLGSIKPCK